MRLASFRAADEDRIGVVLDGGDLIDLGAALRASGVPDKDVPRTMLEQIESETLTLADVRAAVDRGAGLPGAGKSAAGNLAARNLTAGDRAAVQRFASAKSTGGGAIQNIDLNRLGGPVSVVIDRIGTLTNPVVRVS
jgi:hypothetical protein